MSDKKYEHHIYSTYNYAIRTPDGVYMYFSIGISAYIPNNHILDKIEFIGLNNITDKDEIDDVMNGKVNIYGICTDNITDM